MTRSLMCSHSYDMRGLKVRMEADGIVTYSEYWCNDWWYLWQLMLLLIIFMWWHDGPQICQPFGLGQNVLVINSIYPIGSMGAHYSAILHSETYYTQNKKCAHLTDKMSWGVNDIVTCNSQYTFLLSTLWINCKLVNILYLLLDN